MKEDLFNLYSIRDYDIRQSVRYKTDSVLFYNSQPNITVHYKKEPCQGDKNLKEGLTILLAANADE